MGHLPEINGAPACACPADYPDWHQRTLDLGGERVYATRIPTLLHMPIGYDINLVQQTQQLHAFGLNEKWPGLAWLRTGVFGGEIMRFLAEGETAAHRIRYLTKPFLVYSMLHAGDVNSVSSTLRVMQKDLFANHRLPKEWYLAYLTCPVCAKRKGGAKILVMRRFIERSGGKTR